MTASWLEKRLSWRSVRSVKQWRCTLGLSRHGGNTNRTVLGDVNARLKENYVLSTADWEAIKEEVAASNKNTPSPSVPSVGNIDNKTHWMAETYSYFLMFLGPVVLKGRLRMRYYNRFLLLSGITKKLTQMELVAKELGIIHSDIVKWVEGFERLYYRFDMRYVSVCTAPIHAMLHAVDCIKWQGPLSCCWVFSLERFGGWIKSFSRRNKKDVMTWISNELVYREQMLQLSLTIESAAVRDIEKWEDYVNGRPTAYRVWHSRHCPEDPVATPAAMKEAASLLWRPADMIQEALSLHVQTRVCEGHVVPAGHLY